MGFRGHTAYKFRHYTPDPESGLHKLAWASDGLDDSIDLRGEKILRGSVSEKELIEAQSLSLNALADEGEVDILDVYFDDQAVRTTLYFGLTSVAPSETSTLTTLTELTVANNYARIAVTRGTDWGAPTAGGGTASTTKQFSATGAWTGATDLFLGTTASGAGLLIAYAALSQTRTLGNGDTLDVDMTVTLE